MSQAASKLDAIKMFSARDLVGIISTVGVFVWWSSSTFQTKADSIRFQDQAKLEHADMRKEASDNLRMEATARQNLESKMGDIGRDVSYIRGRLEPQPKTK